MESQLAKAIYLDEKHQSKMYFYKNWKIQQPAQGDLFRRTRLFRQVAHGFASPFSRLGKFVVKQVPTFLSGYASPPKKKKGWQSVRKTTNHTQRFTQMFTAYLH